MLDNNRACVFALLISLNVSNTNACKSSNVARTISI